MTLNKYFYKNKQGIYTEGFIGDKEQSSILFILREPNSQGELADTFWFKDIVHKQESNNKYFRVLGKIASILLCGNDYAKALKKCCYINLYPVKGYGGASEEYKQQRKTFGEKKDEYNRWDIINNLPDGSIIVTTIDICENIKKSIVPQKNNQNIYMSTKYLDNKKFDSYKFVNESGGCVTVYSIYHPTSRGKCAYTENDITIK